MLDDWGLICKASVIFPYIQTRFGVHLDSYLIGSTAFFFKVKDSQVISHCFLLLMLLLYVAVLLRLIMFVAVLSHPLYILVDFCSKTNRMHQCLKFILSE